MAVLGLAISARVTSSEQTMPALVGLVVVQLVLCGALVPVARCSCWGSRAAPSGAARRRAADAMAHGWARHSDGSAE
ncbi:hypothetical protein EKO23_14695 [Nocardioides guangzhouensis]|uniref:Uncharacterized protein n=1 Tax=Nocardioides guangzhouensis TaxID=2497878 RepID=A0A4Q4ZBS4_9ACTN|nr:hypothetical protein [Nocardioides guangzhouensis]RYP84761.1 hypothetical protein EKO23_14695 [Nocardioides guangzhouensis]